MMHPLSTLKVAALSPTFQPSSVLPSNREIHLVPLRRIELPITIQPATTLTRNIFFISLKLLFLRQSNISRHDHFQKNQGHPICAHFPHGNPQSTRTITSHPTHPERPFSHRLWRLLSRRLPR